MTAEIGRQPWAVYHVLLTRDALSVTVPASHILFSIITFGIIYLLLFVAWLIFLRRRMYTRAGRGERPIEGGHRMSALQVIWFLLLAFLLAGFTVLSGFDLGIGLLRFFTSGEEQHNRLLAVIGPYWDGNEVWLLAAGGASFAAFPPVYATVFSGLYIPLMVLLFAIIVRAISIDFGAKAPTPRARNAWGIALAISSTVILLLLGVAFGNILRGLPLNAQGDFVGYSRVAAQSLRAPLRRPQRRHARHPRRALPAPEGGGRFRPTGESSRPKSPGPFTSRSPSSPSSSPPNTPTC